MARFEYFRRVCGKRPTHAAHISPHIYEDVHLNAIFHGNVHNNILLPNVIIIWKMGLCCYIYRKGWEKRVAFSLTARKIARHAATQHDIKLEILMDFSIFPKSHWNKVHKINEHYIAYWYLLASTLVGIKKLPLFHHVNSTRSSVLFMPFRKYFEYIIYITVKKRHSPTGPGISEQDKACFMCDCMIYECFWRILCISWNF